MNALLLGLMFGAGAWITYRGWRPPADPLPVALARFDYQPPDTNEPGVSWDTRLGAATLRHVGPVARTIDKANSDLRIVGRSPEEQAARTILYGGFGLFLGPWMGLFAWISSGSTPARAMLGTVSLLGAGIGVLAPWFSIRATAARHRRDFLLALAAWCDMVAMSLAAGRGIEQAMATASLAGEGWAFGELRGALSAGHVRDETPWSSLDALGAVLAIDDLRELASTITMAGEDGATVRNAVATKAHTIRERVISDTERNAERATAEMAMPTLAVAVGFLVFLGYPALVALSRSGL